ncbi:MAG TPA: hypothetical protein VM187_01445, partial [Niastella sp.]|nr:hypothetical protein [Niastella sp.]
VVRKTADGCYSDTFKYIVEIRGPIIDSIYGSLSVCPNSKGVDYWVEGRDGSVFYWDVTGGKQVAGGNTDHIKIDWDEKGIGYVKAVEITKEGCISDTILLPVEKDYVLVTQPIQGDTSVCEYTSAQKYSVLFTNGSTYEWKIIGGAIITGAGSAEITVNWDKEGTGFLVVEETAYDPINKKTCKGKPVSARISIYPLPYTKGIFGPGEICEEDSAIFYVTGRKGSTFLWSIDDDTLFAAANGNDTLKVKALPEDFFGTLTGNHTLRVQEITKDSCFGEILSLPIIIHPMPKTSAINGPHDVCQPHFSGHTYSVTGLPGSTFEWNINGGTITSGLGTNEITVDWLRAGIGELTVQEKSQFGCMGRP